MIRMIFILFISFILSTLIFVFPSNAQVKQDMSGTMISAKVDLPALLSRKNYRLGIRGGIISPTDNLTVSKDSTFAIGLDFDAKLNENLDTGPRFTYVSKKYNNGSTINATYAIIMFGYGGRMYLSYWGDYGSTHGFLNAYVCGDANYCVVSKSTETLTSSPSNFAGFSANAGAGVELAFGPNSTGFFDIRFQKSSIKDSSGIAFPNDGATFNIGTRLAFI